ncbi:MAG: DDE-type integrase/transposase/recombinase [Bilifractor sp.]|jgi:transposase InsO family protein
MDESFYNNKKFLKKRNLLYVAITRSKENLRVLYVDPVYKPKVKDNYELLFGRSNDLSKRTIYRYEAMYRSDAFDGLRPMNRSRRRSAKMPENFDEIIAEAIQLKREVPQRSARVIIKILEIEGWAAPGILKKSTVRRYLFNAGLGVKQMKRSAEKRVTSSRRFCKPHHMELLQADIKYGPVIRDKNGKLIKTYLSSLIDDHSRYILQAEFYDNQCEEIVEDTFHKAILKFGKFDCAYLDNGSQYISKQLAKSCARLSLRLLHAKPRACESKGKIEKYHQKLDKFIAEMKVVIDGHMMEEVVPMTTPDRNRLRRWVYSGHSTDTNPWNYLDEDGNKMNFIDALYCHRKEMWGEYYESFYIVTKNFPWVCICI